MGKTRMVNAIGRILVGNGEDGNAVRMTAQQNSERLLLISETVKWELIFSRMQRYHAHHVVVHHVNDQHQQEDQSHLNKPLFKGQAEIPPPDTF